MYTMFRYFICYFAVLLYVTCRELRCRRSSQWVEFRVLARTHSLNDLWGVFNLKPVFPRYNVTWDADIVIEYLCKMQHVEQLSLKQLTLKLVTLTALVSGQRCQTVYLMNLDTMDVTPSNMTFYIRDITKTTAPGKPKPDIVLPVFSKEPNLCIFTSTPRSIVWMRRSRGVLLIHKHSDYHKIRGLCSRKQK